MIVDVVVIIFCGLSFLFLTVFHTLFIKTRNAKRDKRIKEWKVHGGDGSNVKDSDVKWPNALKASDKTGWKIKDYEDEYDRIEKLGWDSMARLEGFCNLFCKATDLIVVALVTKRTIPHAIFKVRDHFAYEIQDNEMKFFCQRVQHLMATTHREKFLEE
jgi:hypothetical protein